MGVAAKESEQGTQQWVAEAQASGRAKQGSWAGTAQRALEGDPGVSWAAGRQVAEAGAFWAASHLVAAAAESWAAGPPGAEEPVECTATPVECPAALVECPAVSMDSGAVTGLATQLEVAQRLAHFWGSWSGPADCWTLLSPGQAARS